MAHAVIVTTLWRHECQRCGMRGMWSAVAYDHEYGCNPCGGKKMDLARHDYLNVMVVLGTHHSGYIRGPSYFDREWAVHEMGQRRLFHMGPNVHRGLYSVHE